MQTNELVKELSTNFIEYAVAVNSDRSIPDAKCGLKLLVEFYGELMMVDIHLQKNTQNVRE